MIIESKQDFIEARYVNFKRKQEFLDKFLGRGNYILTDLDSYSEEFESLMSHVVICDKCNENITENIIVKDSDFIFHAKCTSNFNNVVSL